MRARGLLVQERLGRPALGGAPVQQRIDVCSVLHNDLLQALQASQLS